MTARDSAVAKPMSVHPVLVISRIFAAPGALVFAAWTRREHFTRWFGPHGATVPYCKMDVRPGGVLHFCHRMASGEDIRVKGTYREVIEPSRLVLSAGFSDKSGNLVERPGFPLETLITVTFSERSGQTEVTVEHAGLVVDQGEAQGWNESLDRLVEHLANVRSRKHVVDET